MRKSAIVDSRVIVSDEAGMIEIIATRLNEVRLSSERYVINTVDYSFQANARLLPHSDPEKALWEITYLGGDRTPWKSAKDFGFSASARKKISAMIPEMLKREMNREAATGLFVEAEMERRRLDGETLRRQLVETEDQVEKLRLELKKLRRGDDYTPYPN